MSHTGLTVLSKIKKNHISRMLHLLDSPDINPCAFWRFGMLKQILRDREFFSSDEIEGAIAQIWNELTSDVQSMFRDWIPLPAWVAENDGERIGESNEIRVLMSTACCNWDRGRGLSGHSVFDSGHVILFSNVRQIMSSSFYLILFLLDVLKVNLVYFWNCV
jgi:hypothetical protein